MSDFLQFQLWRDCSNCCKFCNAGVSTTSSEYKLYQLSFVDREVESSAYKGITRVGLIGGEFFTGQLNNPAVEEAFTALLIKLTNRFEQVLIASNLLFNDRTQLLRILHSIPNSNKIMICTSWDTIYRFHTPEDEDIWKNNILFLTTSGLVQSVHTEIILTQAFIESVLEENFSIPDFEQEFNTRIDFNAPCTSACHTNKYDMEKELPGFFPKRNDFLKFLRKVYLEGQAGPDRFCNYENMSTNLWVEIDGKYQFISGLRGPIDGKTVNSDYLLPTMHEIKSDYIDSHVRMRRDVLDMWETIYG